MSIPDCNFNIFNIHIEFMFQTKSRMRRETGSPKILDSVKRLSMRLI